MSLAETTASTDYPDSAASVNIGAISYRALCTEADRYSGLGVGAGDFFGRRMTEALAIPALPRALPEAHRSD
jgi:hypothetical protein